MKMASDLADEARRHTGAYRWTALRHSAGRRLAVHLRQLLLGDAEEMGKDRFRHERSSVQTMSFTSCAVPPERYPMKKRRPIPAAARRLPQHRHACHTCMQDERRTIMAAEHLPTIRKADMAIPLNASEPINGRSIEADRVEFISDFNPEPIIHATCAFASDIDSIGGGCLVIGIEERDSVPQLPPKGCGRSRIDSILRLLPLHRAAL